MSSSDSSSDSDSGGEISELAFNPKYRSKPCTSSSLCSTKQDVLSGSQDVRLPRTHNEKSALSSALDPGIDLPQTYLSIHPERNPSEVKEKMKKLSMKSSVNELLNKSVVCQPGFEKLPSVPPYIVGRRRLKKERLKERDKTKGPGWFNLPATEMTEEVKNDLTVLQMRKAIDPKHFYKRGALKTLPKYFQIGTVVEPPIDFYHARIPKRQRKRTLVEELLADSEFRKFQKKKYEEALKSQPQKKYHSRKKRRKLREVMHSEVANKKKRKK